MTVTAAFTVTLFMSFFAVITSFFGNDDSDKNQTTELPLCDVVKNTGDVVKNTGDAVKNNGDVVKNKKGSKGKGGSNAVEPYAYWPLDRKMLNRRPTKARVAAGGLEKVVAAGRAGAKAAARDAKRRRK